MKLISTTKYPWGINHFGSQVESVKGIEEAAQTLAEANTSGAVAESWIHDQGSMCPSMGGRSEPRSRERLAGDKALFCR